MLVHGSYIRAAQALADYWWKEVGVKGIVWGNMKGKRRKMG